MRPSHLSAVLAAFSFASTAAHAQGVGIESGNPEPTAETAQQIADAPDVLEYSCSAVVEQGDDGGALVAMPLLKVMEATAADGDFVLALDDSFEVHALMCDRSSPVPTRMDYKVPDAGYPLYVRSGKNETRVVTALEKPDGVFDLRVVEGELSSQDEVLIDARLETYPSAAGE